MNLNQHRLKRYLIAAAVMIFVIMAVWRRNFSIVGFSDACAITGICFLILALFRTAKYMRFYDLIIFGGKKFMEIWKNEDLSRKGSRVGQYHEFVQNQEHEADFKEVYLVTACCLICSVAVLLFL